MLSVPADKVEIVKVQQEQIIVEDALKSVDHK